APDGYLVTDRRGIILEVNASAAALFRVPKQSLLGKPLGFYVARQDFNKFLADASAARRGRGRDFTTRLRPEQGDTFDVLVTLAMADDNYVRWLIRDITERKRTEEKLRSSERLATMGATALLLAQEISNPLNDIFTTVQQLGRASVAGKKISEGPLGSTLQELTWELSHLRGLLEKFCSFSQPPNLNLDSVDLARIISELLTREARECAEHGIQVKMGQIVPQRLAVEGDYEKLKQVFVNLCRNAVEAMPRGGKLAVNGSTSNGQVSLEFMDTGVGVPKDLDVFDLFTTTKFQAMGMGLPIAQQIIADHGGKLSYTSVPGKTVFRVDLPITPPRPQR
ncbi:MAG TPA: ATP-binding protein, partial [Candidatus Binatia bacterium]|nr:ATP-binding protein [Candidatus Binatia bacterium]